MQLFWTSFVRVDDYSSSTNNELSKQAGQSLEKRVLMECETSFYEVVAVMETYRELCQNHVIPQTVADKITKSHSVEDARGYLFDHMRDYGTFNTLNVFCDVIISDKYNGFQAMQNLGSEMKRRLNQEVAYTQTQIASASDGTDSVMSQEVCNYPNREILFRTYAGRQAGYGGRALLEGVGLAPVDIDNCFAENNRQEDAIQAGLTKWANGFSSKCCTWEVLIWAMQYAGIGKHHIEALKCKLTQDVPSYPVVPVSGTATALHPPIKSPALHAADIIEDLNHQLDEKWRHFGTSLRVDYPVIQTIQKSYHSEDDCMLDLLGMWTTYHVGTGHLPRTWQTVVEAVKKTGFHDIAHTLAHNHGVSL